MTELERCTANLIRVLRAAPAGVFQYVSHEVKALEAAVAKADAEALKRRQSTLGWDDG